MSARRPREMQEAFLSWLVTKSRHGTAWLAERLALQTLRGRELYRAHLERICDAAPDQGRATAALAEINRFLADPVSYVPAEGLSAPGRTPGLAGPHLAVALQAQALAMGRRFDEAAAAMEQARQILLRAESSPRWSGSLALDDTPAQRRAARTRTELAALAKAFIANALARTRAHDAAGAKESLREIAEACTEQPSFAYLHRERAELLAEAGDYTSAFEALSRHVALRGAATSLIELETLAERAASLALNAASPAREPAEREAGRTLVARAETRMRAIEAEHHLATQGELWESEETRAEFAVRRAMFAFWRARLLLRQAEFRIGDSSAADESASALVDKAASLIAMVPQTRFPAAEEARENAASWLKLTQDQLELYARPGEFAWPRLALAMQRARIDSAESVLLQRAADRIATAAEPLGVAGFRAQRLLVEYPSALLPDYARAQTKALIGDPQADDESQTLSIAQLHRRLKREFGIRMPGVLLQPVTGGSPTQIRVLLDGVPIGIGNAAILPRVIAEPAYAEIIVAPNGDASGHYEAWRAAPDWFGASLLIGEEPRRAELPAFATRHPPETAIVLFLGITLCRNLDLLADGWDAAAAGVDDAPYCVWSPTLRLLLAERTPLLDRRRLAEAVGAVRRGDVGPLEAASLYRRRAVVQLWGTGPRFEDIEIPEEHLEVLRRDLRNAVDLGVAAIPAASWRQIEGWVRSNLRAGGEATPRRLIVPDETARPQLRQLLRRAFADLPVLTREELSRAAT